MLDAIAAAGQASRRATEPLLAETREFLEWHMARSTEPAKV